MPKGKSFTDEILGILTTAKFVIGMTVNNISILLRISKEKNKLYYFILITISIFLYSIMIFSNIAFASGYKSLPKDPGGTLGIFVLLLGPPIVLFVTSRFAFWSIKAMVINAKRQPYGKEIKDDIEHRFDYLWIFSMAICGSFYFFTLFYKDNWLFGDCLKEPFLRTISVDNLT